MSTSGFTIARPRAYRPAGQASLPRPTARSAVPGSLWWILRDPAGGPPTVYLTQWDALLRRFQAVAKSLLPPAFVFADDGDCAQTFWGALSLIGANWRRTDQITVDGIWGPETSDALGALLCRMGQTTLARNLATDRHLQRISLSTLVAIAYFATLVSRLDGNTPVTNPPGIRLDQVVFAADTVLPLWSTRVRSAPQNANWIGMILPTGGGFSPPTQTTGTTNEPNGNAQQPPSTDTALIESMRTSAENAARNIPPSPQQSEVQTSSSAEPASGFPWVPVILGTAAVGVIALALWPTKKARIQQRASSRRVTVQQILPASRQLPAPRARRGTTITVR